MRKIDISHYIGCLIGGAIGDALGAPIEFLSLSQIRAKFGKDGISDFIEFENNTGEFTDDTQMTLFTAEALLRAYHRAMIKGIGGALNAIAHHSYLRWLHTQNIGVNAENIKEGKYDVKEGWLIKEKVLYSRRAPGNTCIFALSSGIAGTIGNPINDSKGCGTIMRVAPVGLMFEGDRENAFKVACELSAITHGHPTGYLSAGFFASIISDLAIGIELRKSIDNAIQILENWENHAETKNAVNAAIDLFEKTKSYSDKISAETIEKLGQGWIAEEALSMSLYASLIFERDFKKGILFSVNHSGDSDSTGSITGNILGLINGIDKIPVKWKDNLIGHEIVKQVAEDLHIKMKGDSLNSNDEWWKKYPGF
jgi:ADP-ribosylglycohydrolase